MPNALQTPEAVTERLTALGGRNPFGQPNYRAVWGGTRTCKCGGRFKDVIYEDNPAGGHQLAQVIEKVEVREILKYHPERWHLERWLPAAIYGTAEQWFEQTWDEVNLVHKCGDYPAEGDYEHVYYLAECPHMFASEAAFLAQHPLPRQNDFMDFNDYSAAFNEWQALRANGGIGEWCNHCKLTMGVYIPLEPNLWIFERQIKLLEMSQNVSYVEECAALFAREAEAKRAAKERVGNITRDRMMIFGAISHCYQGDSEQRHSVPDARVETKFNPLGRSKFKQSNRVLPAHKQAELDKA